MGAATFSYAAQDVQVSRRAGCPRATDALDNIRSADVGTRQYRYNYDANNRLLDIKNPAGVQQFAFTYDSRGNTTAKGSQAYAFDYGNRLNEVTGSQVYRYDGQGRRVQTTDVADSKTTFWIYSQAGQVLYTSEARRNQNISYIYLGNTQVATKTVAWAPVSTTTIAYQHTDSLGSIVAETNASRVVVKRNSYEPYGGAWNSTIDGTGYTGHVMDQATGLTYMQQRYYDPAIGRFLSTDPMASDANNAWNFNRYNYAANSPYKFKDPDGRGVEWWNVPAHITNWFATTERLSMGSQFAHANGDEAAAESFDNAIQGQLDSAGNAITLMATAAIPGASAEATLGRSLFKNTLSDGTKMLYRRGASDSTKLLARQAADAEKKIGIHGVSVNASSAAKQGQVVRGASEAAIKDAGLKTTKTGADPGHFTVEIPKPVTEAFTKVWNEVFKVIE